MTNNASDTSFANNESGIVWSLLVILSTLVTAILVIAVMGPVFDDFYFAAHGAENNFNMSAGDLETFDSCYGMVKIIPLSVLVSFVLLIIIRGVLQY